MMNDNTVATQATKHQATVVLGAQWGDEGKGKVVDMIASKADIVCRCQVRVRFEKKFIS